MIVEYTNKPGTELGDVKPGTVVVFTVEPYLVLELYYRGKTIGYTRINNGTDPIVCVSLVDGSINSYRRDKKVNIRKNARLII